ncbi:Hypothetical predicted protein [Olea europaea subsp. europaea]|uniref:Uncharacterized protein n=1 Tax=Olea europaea subsp. europaea TaxID=158383 RepID=A0A8S0SD56_OLEEU|nr:Hypothetical predicted protein [Olea europaea subsp. europaea]
MIHSNTAMMKKEMHQCRRQRGEATLLYVAALIFFSDAAVDWGGELQIMFGPVSTFSLFDIATKAKEMRQYQCGGGDVRNSAKLQF